MLWILGLAELLAVLSHAYWLGGARQKSLFRVLSAPSFRIAIAAGFVLFALGVLLSVDAWWERMAWVGAMILAAREGIVAWQAWHIDTKGG